MLDVVVTRDPARIRPGAMPARSPSGRPLRKVERGNPGVSLGIYATVLFVLGLTPRLAELAATRSDEVGLQLEDDRLPRRARVRGKTIRL